MVGLLHWMFHGNGRGQVANFSDRIAVGDIRQLIAENQLDSAEFARGKQTPLAEGATPLMFAVAVGNERAVR